MKTVVITGGPGTGKTSIIKLLAKRFPVIKESARLVLARNKMFRGKNAIQAKGKNFQEAIWDLEVKHYMKALLLRNERLVFFDRGFFDGFAYSALSRLNGLQSRVMQGRLLHYDYVFIIDPLPKSLYSTDEKRKETYPEALKIHKIIEKMYRKYGYKPIHVPFDTVENRVKFIVRKLHAPYFS
ncbi:MAG TPA: ATP-binding protein [Candidatus Nanoarchaeia archaeon]|nr:ATP-binding protein [Candidatus Nanoarchaeia archaeon]